MGSVTVTLDLDPTEAVGQKRAVFGTLSLSASYANPGGDTFTVGQFGLGLLDAIETFPDTANGNNAVPMLGIDRVNNKILAYGTAGSASGLTEIANATNLSAIVYRFIAWGV